MIIVATAESAEQALTAGTMRCPRGGCVGTLARWGYGRRRRIRGLEGAVIDARPRRVRCDGCGTTQILLPAALQPRRADTTEVIGIALARKATGLGHRRIAAALGRSPSTVRRWCRRARDCGHLNWLWQRGAQELIRLDADAFNQLTGTGNLLRDALAMLAAAAWWTRQRLGIAEPPWSLIGLYTRGHLLAPPG
ncbi:MULTISPECIES: helix-turn-helix domain-containing protein [Mycobacterium avium complex (MAC)]|uniref:Helix-turn-helix domain-containing protein n=3 Tax=Mycobacterium avium complex (MAC) TaxID=120793 RepID=A0A7U5MRN9_MYCIT|nr:MULTISPECIES: helix-turn-helix domain-containing protein [Mycobacterium avium complex (MAC)]MCA2238871.1 helix-turn-helix domain-containing protein [Mycobacterium avium]AOS90783.1 RNA polymerase subunit sigma-70 [Mycobacterium intracellulare subsp. chimaera]AOS90785.1 RNA polymerase subunit sigma-70 [Mycobacterium intracellulare subsp. chimaera]AOS90851.1 RNA polymerase subunit sigma-70 [Mycobacterium intracellulare subsp. chimaera]AOS91145.1 RNA polymerase subunit sigma-70 [Mycobacterium i